MSHSRSSPSLALDDEERLPASPPPSTTDNERPSGDSTRIAPRPSSSSSASKGGFAQWATSSSQVQPSDVPPAKSRIRPQRSRNATGTTTATASTEDSVGSSDEDSDELDDDESRHERGMSTSSVTIPPDQQLSRSDLVYVLEVVQQPQRARACGFGDKDRRPLSPPPIIQLRIFDKLGNAIKPHAIDVHRFILMVDLWNGDRTQQRSIVMHPGARPDQYALFTHTASRTASTHRYDAPHSTFNRAPHRSMTGPAPGPYAWPSYGRPSLSPSPSYHSQPLPSYPPTPGSGSVPGWPPPGHPEHPMASPAWVGAYSLPPEEYDHHRSPPPPRRRPMPGEMRPPPIHDPSAWSPESTMGGPDYSSERHASSSWSSYRPATSSADSGWGREPSYREPRPHTSGFGEWDRGSVGPPGARPWSSTASDPHRPWSSHGSLYTHAPSPVTQQSSLPLTASPVSTPSQLYPETPYPERLSTTSYYSRVLVGSMGAVCQRLKDLNGDPGLFFFAHDLGIRTEGTFSLRFTLVDLTSSLAGPEVHKDDSTEILARIFSDAFTVYSAKRFPGVLPTTELTQCFADQSVRLPTRQKRAIAGIGSSSKRKK
ncbi:hypothetical protein CC85DRAFT_103035 [Cutaneotrichosporon oleaginosum]|uniref:Velvet domain-containing protein n=1 Tax=Cutaneotrichosporon oleaginosum TaxID=879819 RepID=A0A0J0XLI2_9TREE|nr:uncharacterized protein CC85DRAFT_103035 [Cutaneotrichosporon oleaginosum]KLT41951.1 hypothetical protein CC85DRAFT_103035 [Cutaneotrichosporon oleaginosum]TXT12550.1 hypothetical protein COLE_02960 [Cutaneotrichosporon oleaginosum]